MMEKTEESLSSLLDLVAAADVLAESICHIGTGEDRRKITALCSVVSATMRNGSALGRQFDDELDALKRAGSAEVAKTAIQPRSERDKFRDKLSEFETALCKAVDNMAAVSVLRDAVDGVALADKSDRKVVIGLVSTLSAAEKAIYDLQAAFNAAWATA